MSALFNFQSLLTITILLICACAYIRSLFPSLLDRNKTGFVFYIQLRIFRLQKDEYVLINNQRDVCCCLYVIDIFTPSYFYFQFLRCVLEMCSDWRKEKSVRCCCVCHDGCEYFILGLMWTCNISPKI